MFSVFWLVLIYVRFSEEYDTIWESAISPRFRVQKTTNNILLARGGEVYFAISIDRKKIVVETEQKKEEKGRNSAG